MNMVGVFQQAALSRLFVCMLFMAFSNTVVMPVNGFAVCPRILGTTKAALPSQAWLQARRGAYQ